MKISRKMMKTLEQVAESNFALFMVSYVTARHSAAVAGLPTERVSNMIHGYIDTAERLGITDRRNVAMYIVIMFHINRSEDDSSWASTVLSNSNLTPTQRVDCVFDTIYGPPSRPW